MGIVNLSPDSKFGSIKAPFGSRTFEERLLEWAVDLISRGAEILDFGAVSTRPGAPVISLEEEWSRFEPLLGTIKSLGKQVVISIDTTSSEIVRRLYPVLGPFIVNDISAGGDDPQMLDTIREFSLECIAMHKRGTPSTMDTLCDYSEYATEKYPSGVIPALLEFFKNFEGKAAGINWTLDPGLGFAKTSDQCWEILENLSAFKIFGRPILVSCSDKRFTLSRPSVDPDALAIRGGASILRIH